VRWLTRKSDKPDKMGSVTDELAKEVSTLFEGEIVKPDWLSADISIATQSTTTGPNVVKEVEDQTKPYLHLCKTLTTLQEELKKRQGDLSTGRSRLQEEVDSVGELEDRLERLRKENANKKSALEAMQSKVKSKNTELDETRTKLEEYSSKVNKYLGLDVAIYSDDTPTILLTLRVPRSGRTTDTASEGSEGDTVKCECEMTLDPVTNQYKVIRTKPPSLALPTDSERGAFTEKLQHLLNETQDLSGFVVALRRRFMAILAATNTNNP